MRNRSGFTLIELLVVVAIISALMAILLPSLGKAREQAVTLKCLSTLRTLGTANLIYANESVNCYLPIANSTVSSGTPGSRWYNNDLFRSAIGLQSLAGAPSLSNSLPMNMLCPRSYGAMNPQLGQNNLYYAGYTYGMNYFGLSSNATTLPVRAYRVSQVNTPHLRMAFADAVDWQLAIANGNNGESKYIDPPSYGESGWVGQTLYSANSQMLAYRHGEKTNMVFYDGHAETMKFSYVKTKRYEIYSVLGQAGQ